MSFRPSPLPPDPVLTIDREMIRLLVEAKEELVKLETASSLIPNAELFISMYVRKEALLSSQIEGTQCTLDDVLDPDIDKNKNLNVEEVINYVRACLYSIDRLRELPLCNRFIRELHKELMSGVRGKEKNPGEFRRSQNWIGAANCSLIDARYIPPNVEDMNVALDDLEKYINEGVEYDPLIRAALIHYQFETIHPFLDGNGRVGRLLIMLYLLEQKCISKPILYISYFLKKNQVEYYDRISEVRKSGNYEQWVRFFLEAVREASKDSFETTRKLSELHNRNYEKLPASFRRQNNIMRVFDYLEVHPIIAINNTARELNVSYNTASSAVEKLLSMGVLEETTNSSRNRVFVYKEYLDILRKDT